MVVLGLAVAMSVQIVGALLVLSLLVTPAAAAMRVTASSIWVPVLATIFAITSVVGGASCWRSAAPCSISPYVTTISFAIYCICRVVGARRTRRGLDFVARFPLCGLIGADRAEDLLAETAPARARDKSPVDDLFQDSSTGGPGGSGPPAVLRSVR